MLARSLRLLVPVYKVPIVSVGLAATAENFISIYQFVQSEQERFF